MEKEKGKKLEKSFPSSSSSSFLQNIKENNINNQNNNLNQDNNNHQTNIINFQVFLLIIYIYFFIIRKIKKLLRS